MTVFDVLELGLDYPRPGAAGELSAAIGALPAGSVRSELEAFVGEVARLDLGAWEELHTRTLDLSPLFVPYVGHVVWGESYRRGAFMADLQREQIAAGVDQRGELPDHIAPLLAYLQKTDEPIQDLVDVLPQAVAAMRKELRKSEPDNPYRHLLAAVAAAIDAHLAQGASR